MNTDKQAVEKIMDEVIQSNLKIRQSYELLISTSEERAIYKEWVQASDSYDAGVREVLALSRNSVGKIPHEAHQLNVTSVNPIAIKAALNLTGHEVGGHRLPMVEADEDELSQIRSCLERSGMLAPASA